MHAETRLQRISEERLKPWIFVGPALLWTAAFFILPFAAMGVVSLWIPASADRAPGFSLANYAQFFANPSYFQAMVNSLEVTVMVTVLSILLAYPLAWVISERVP
jgi:spermidine/putrescine transport system permease protein